MSFLSGRRPYLLEIYYILTFFIYLFVPSVSIAAGVSSLKESVSFAIEHNRMLAIAASHVDKAEAEVDMATGQMLPRVDVSTGLSRTNSPLNSFGAKLQQQRITAADFSPATLNNPGYINNYQSRLVLNMPLFAGGAMWAARARAKHYAEASALAFEFRKQQLIYQTIVAYVQTRQASAQVKVRENAVKAADKHWQDAKALKKRGMAIDSDVMDAYVHMLRSQVALDEARSAHLDALEALRLILGMDGASELNALEEPAIHFTAEPLEKMLEYANSRRADFLAMQNELEAAKSARTQSQASYLPQVNLIAAQEWNSETFGLKNRNAMVGVTVDVNLFAGGADRARVRAAESERVALEFQIGDRRQQIGNEIRQAFRTLRTAETRFRSEAEALKQTVESLRIKSLRHAQGLEKTSDLLDAQVRADSSEVAYIRAKYDLMIAKAALLLAAGTLDEEVVQ
jgi:outer membrane protein TolC